MRTTQKIDFVHFEEDVEDGPFNSCLKCLFIETQLLLTPTTGQDPRQYEIIFPLIEKKQQLPSQIPE